MDKIASYSSPYLWGGIVSYLSSTSKLAVVALDTEGPGFESSHGPFLKHYIYSLFHSFEKMKIKRLGIVHFKKQGHLSSEIPKANVIKTLRL